MKQVNAIPVDVIDKTNLPALSLEMIPVEGDPVEINGETYFVCEVESVNNDETYRIGVIPLLVKNPANVRDIRDYMKCLSLAHRRFRFRKGESDCTLEECDEMIIS